MRGMGIATMLLERVCKDAEKDGFDFVEAYPNKNFVDTASDFMGPVSLYEKKGFTGVYEIENKIVMQKRLNKV